MEKFPRASLVPAGNGTLPRSTEAHALAPVAPTQTGARWHAPGLMAASAILFGLMAVTLRLAVTQVSSFEAAFFRSLFGLLFSLPLLYKPGFALLRTRIFTYIVRDLFGTLAMLTGFGVGPSSAPGGLIASRPAVRHDSGRGACSARCAPARTAFLAGFVGVLVIMPRLERVLVRHGVALASAALAVPSASSSCRPRRTLSLST
jgi:hypothetical protein